MQLVDVFFMRPDEVPGTMTFLANFSTASVDQKNIDLAGSLYRKWNPSHGIDINDAVLAATVVETGGKIFCLNVKHYPMDEVVAEKAGKFFSRLI